MARLMVRRESRGVDDGLPARALVGSMGLHAGVLAVLFVGATRLAIPEPKRVYQVELVTAPSAAPVRDVPAPKPASARPELVPTEPQPVVTKPIETKRRQPEQKPREEPPTKAEEKPAEQPSERPEAAAPTETAETADELPVRLEGAPFPYPEYLENVIVQIRRHWRPPTGGRRLRAELGFTILRDGSVEDIDWVRRSGDPVFDLEARGAIEAAGRRGAFGALPADYPGDRLRVSFFFDPSRY